MSILFVCEQETVGSISSGSINLFLSLTRLVEAELGGIFSGFSPIVSDEILIDKERFINFVDNFFDKAQYHGKFIYFIYWAFEINEIYKKITQRVPIRKILNAEYFENYF